MELSDLFNKKTLKEIAKVLEVETADNAAINRAVLAEKLGLLVEVPPAPEKSGNKRERGPHSKANSHNLAVQTILSLLINSKIIPGYRSDVGIGGGIGREDRQKSQKSASNDDIQAVSEALEALLPAGAKQKTTREAVARKAFGEGTIKNMTRVSSALDSSLGDLYVTRTGPSGGIYRADEAPTSKAKKEPVAQPPVKAAPAPTPVDPDTLSDEERAIFDEAKARSEQLEAETAE